jgi:hypothetical protein
MSVSIDNEELKACLLKGCESTFIDKEDVVLEVFDKFFFEKEDENDTLTHPTKWWKTYDVGTLHEIGGKISFMWLTEDGRAIRSDRGSHFTILNWALYNYLKDKSEERKKEVTEYFWNVEEIKNHNVDDVIQLRKDKKDIKNNNLELAELMEKFMREFKLVRLSGPYRNKEFGGSSYGHASKLLERASFTIESFHTLTKKQVDFLKYIVDYYKLLNVDVSGDNSGIGSEVHVLDYSNRQLIKKQLQQK